MLEHLSNSQAINQRFQKRKLKSKHLAIMQSLQQQEKGWNNRFHLDQIPQIIDLSKKNYHVKKGQSFLKPLGNKISRNQQSPSRPATQQQMTRAATSQSNRRIQYQQSQQQQQSANFSEINSLQKCQEKLIATWNYHGIPFWHRKVFQEFLGPITTMHPFPIAKQMILITKEEESISKGTSEIVRCLKAVEARELCLQKLVNLIESDPSEKDEVISAELITHLRILTVSVVEAIVRWRRYFQLFTAEDEIGHVVPHNIPVPFYIEEENYLLKIQNDVTYIQNSRLKEFFNFSVKSDPFMLNIASDKLYENQDNIQQFVSKQLLNRIRARSTYLIYIMKKLVK